MSSLRTVGMTIGDMYEYGYLLLGIIGALSQRVRQEYKWILIFLVSMGLARIVSIFLAINYINTIPLYHLFGAMELFFVYKIFHRYDLLLVWKPIFFILCTAYLVYTFAWSGLYEMNGFSQAIVQLFIFGLAVNYLFVRYNQAGHSKAISHFFFANAGFIFYATGTFLVFVINQKLIGQIGDELFDSAWIIEAVFGLIRLLFISMTFYKLRYAK